jgi:hypothetical protein
MPLAKLGVSLPGEGPSNAVDPNIYTGPTRVSQYVWPAIDVIGINLALWSVPFAIGSPWAKTGPKYWKSNFKAGLQWDDNEFEVNQFFHPYQGGMYFTAARVNGLTFWEAVPYTAFGSWMWEYFMETEQASTNDWMTTTWGGFFFGESLYRLSNRIVDETDSGGSRFWKEFGALAVSPINGIDRIGTGRAWADGPPRKPVPLLADFRLGVDGIGLGKSKGWGQTVRASIRFDYGDPYAKPYIKVPFEAFDLAVQVNASPDNFGEGFDGTGVLLGKRYGGGGANVNLLALVLGYEYFTNATDEIGKRKSEGTYQLGEIGVGGAWYGKWRLPNDWTVDSKLDLLAVPTGAVSSPDALYEVNRVYNFGAGGAVKAEVNLRQKRLGRLYAEVNRYLYRVVNGVPGTDNVGVLRLGAYANVYKGHGLGAAAIYYDRSSYYDDYPDVFDHFWSGQAHYEVEW